MRIPSRPLAVLRVDYDWAGANCSFGGRSQWIRPTDLAFVGSLVVESSCQKALMSASNAGRSRQVVRAARQNPGAHLLEAA